MRRVIWDEITLIMTSPWWVTSTLVLRVSFFKFTNPTKNTPVPYPNMYYLITEMPTHIHISVIKRCIVGLVHYGTYATGLLGQGFISIMMQLSNKASTEAMYIHLQSDHCEHIPIKLYFMSKLLIQRHAFESEICKVQLLPADLSVLITMFMLSTENYLVMNMNRSFLGPENILILQASGPNTYTKG